MDFRGIKCSGGEISKFSYDSSTSIYCMIDTRVNQKDFNRAIEQTRTTRNQ